MLRVVHKHAHCSIGYDSELESSSGSVRKVITSADILNRFSVSILTLALRGVWKDNSKLRIVVFGIKEKVGPMRVGGLLELQLPTVCVSVLFEKELLYNENIHL